MPALPFNLPNDRMMLGKLAEYVLIVGNGGHWAAPELVVNAGRDVVQGLTLITAGVARRRSGSAPLASATTQPCCFRRDMGNTASTDAEIMIVQWPGDRIDTVHPSDTAVAKPVCSKAWLATPLRPLNSRH